MLLNIAEDPSKLPEDEAKDIARLLGEHFEDEDLKNQFFEVFIQLFASPLHAFTWSISLI